MDEEEQKEFAEFMSELQDLVYLTRILQSIVDRLSEQANSILYHIKEEEDDIGFDQEENTS